MPPSKRRVLPNISSPVAPAKLFGQIQLEQLLIPAVLLHTAYYLESGGHRGLINSSPNIASWVFWLKFIKSNKGLLRHCKKQRVHVKTSLSDTRAPKGLLFTLHL